MDKETIARYAASLDTLLNKDENGVEFWHARELMKYMGYTKWENFAKVIQRAQSACQNAGQPVEAHFRDAKRDVELGSGAIRSIDDVKLTRYACYLVAQNGDPRKEEVALLQSYFAVQTRTAELLEQRMGEILRIAGRHALTAEEKQLSSLAYKRGVGEKDFGVIRSRGDQALFGILLYLLYLVVFRFGLTECLEIGKRWYFNVFTILQVVTGYDCMEHNVTVFVCGLYAEWRKSPSLSSAERGARVT